MKARGEKGSGPPAQIDYRDGQPKSLQLRRVKLVVENPLGGVREYVFDQDTITIGSAESNDVVINDSRVSRRHCRITQEPAGYVLIDEGSTNGSYLGRVRVREAYLKSGATFSVGGVEVRFQTFDQRFDVTPSVRDSFGELIGRSRAMRQVFSILEKIAPTGATVVIEGETGSGKELAARAIHAMSPRSSQPLVVFDCSAVPKELIESELFGHEKGSFTGAVQTRQGLFEIAHRGTLFLDEIGELSFELQPKLLRALEHREIRRVGSNRCIKVDVRLIAATNRDLEEEMRAGRFREDLFYRLSVVRIKLPPLRERKQDIPLLARHFLQRAPFNRDVNGGLRVRGFTTEALEALMSYHWPGNVRELLNVVERAISFAEGDIVDVHDLPEHILGHVPTVRRRSDDETTDPMFAALAGRLPFKQAKELWIQRFEREYLSALLKRNKYSLSAAAREADLDRKYLRKLARRYGLIDEKGSQKP